MEVDDSELETREVGEEEEEESESSDDDDDIIIDDVYEVFDREAYVPSDEDEDNDDEVSTEDDEIDGNYGDVGSEDGSEDGSESCWSVAGELGSVKDSRVEKKIEVKEKKFGVKAKEKVDRSMTPLRIAISQWCGGAACATKESRLGHNLNRQFGGGMS